MRRAFVLAALLTVASLDGASADVSPGDRITKDNVAKVEDLVSPGVQWCIKRGLPLTIVESKSVGTPPAYKQATEKYSGQVKLAADGLNIENYVAGKPFPEVDSSDPKAATKIMWNFEYKWLLTDDSVARNFDADTGPIFGGSTPMSVERHFLIDSVRQLRYAGRLYLDPKPTWETKEGYQSKGTLHPILEPFDLKGVGGLTYRYLDPAKADDTWIYMPSLRRVRRLSTAQRSDALFGQDIDVDSFNGYAGHIAWMDWKLLGEKEMLGSVHGKNFPAKWAEGGADFAFDDVWEKRDVYVVEGISKLSQYAYGKRIIFLDKETYAVLFSDIFDRSGGLWKVFISSYTFRKKPFEGATESVYDHEMPFAPAIMMVDTQLQHATKVSIPSRTYPGEEGFFFNKGEKVGNTEEMFSIAHIIASGR